MVEMLNNGAGFGGWNRRKQLSGMAVGLAIFAAGTARADINSVLDKITDRATQARDKAAAAKEGIDEIRQRMKEGAKNLTGEVRAILDEQMNRFKAYAAERVVITEEFVSSGACEAKRAQLIEVLRQLQYVAALIQELSEICPAATRPMMDLEPVITALEELPCGVMIPMAHLEMSPCLVDQLAECAEALRLVRQLRDSDDAMDADDTGAASAFEAEYAKCAFWLENYRAIGKAQKSLSDMSTNLGLLGKVFSALGETEIEANLGIHGYALATLKDNPVKRWSSYIDGVSSGLGKVATKIEGKMSRCVDLSAQATIMSNQERILQAIADSKQGS